MALWADSFSRSNPAAFDCKPASFAESSSTDALSASRSLAASSSALRGSSASRPSAVIRS